MGTISGKKLKFISYAYVIGAILVVLGHSTPTGNSDLPIFVDQIRTFIYCFHMPLFFFIAGFLFKYTTDKNKKPYVRFIKNKAVRFLTPYFVLSAIGILPKILLANFVNDEVSFDIYYVFETIFNPRLNVWGHFWFLPTLLLIYAISYLILKCYNHKILYRLLLVLALLLAVLPINTDWFAIKDICSELIYFCIGIFSCNYIVENRNKIFRLPNAMISIIIAIAYYAYMTVNNFFWLDWLRNLSAIIIAFLMIYAILYFSVLFEEKGNRWLDFLDGKTFSIYIISWPCQAAVEVFLNRVLQMHWYITLPVMFLAGLIIPLMFLHFYKKIKHQPKFINLVFGVN